MSQCALSIIPGKKVWKAELVSNHNLENELNRFSNEGYEIFKIERHPTSASTWSIIGYKIEV